MLSVIMEQMISGEAAELKVAGRQDDSAAPVDSRQSCIVRCSSRGCARPFESVLAKHEMHSRHRGVTLGRSLYSLESAWRVPTGGGTVSTATELGKPEDRHYSAPVFVAVCFHLFFSVFRPGLLPSPSLHCF